MTTPERSLGWCRLPLALAVCALCPVFSSCGTGSKVPVALEASVAVASSSTSGVEGAIYEGIDAYRCQRGLERQQRDPGLERMAFLHAREMAAKSKFEHSNMEYAEQVATRRYRLFNVEENILRASRLGVDQLPGITVENWVRSRGHRINVETENPRIGVGVSEAADGSFYVCAITASPIKRTIEEDRLSRLYGTREGEFQGIGW